MPNKREQPWDRQKGESARAFEAFLVYLQMGPERSVRAVAQKLSKSYKLAGRWSSTSHGVERCRAWDNYLQQEAKKAAAAAVRNMNRRHAQMAAAIQGTAMQALQERGADMVNPNNFAAIVKLAAELERQSLTAELSEHDPSGPDQREDDPITASLKEDIDRGLL